MLFRTFQQGQVAPLTIVPPAYSIKSRTKQRFHWPILSTPASTPSQIGSQLPGIDDDGGGEPRSRRRRTSVCIACNHCRVKKTAVGLLQQILTGSFEYPSPDWDAVSDTALDLIDRMLAVELDARINIDECLEHPWIARTDCSDGSQMRVADRFTGSSER